MPSTSSSTKPAANQPILTRPAVTIIVLCYIEKGFLPTLLSSIKSLSYQGAIQTILVDNNSADGSADFVEKNYPWVKLIRNEKNIGTPGFNLALPHVKGKYTVWVGSDTKFDKDAITSMVEYLEQHPLVGGLYPRVLDWEGHYLEGWHCFSRTLYFFSLLKKTQEQEYPAIGPGMLRKEIIDKIGYLYDPDYFYSYEDVDLCLRVRMLGYSVEFHREAILYHRGSISFNKQNKPARMVFLGDRNSLITMLKIDQARTLAAYLPYALFLRLALTLKEFFTLQFSRGTARIRALLWVLFHLPLVLRKRKEAQARRAVGDDFVYAIANEKEFIKEGLKKLFVRETFDVQEFHKKHRKKL